MILTSRILVAACSLGALAPLADKPAFSVAEKTKLEKKFSSTRHLETDSFELFIDGQPAPDGMAPKVELAIDDKVAMHFTETYAKVAHGKALEIEREYVDVSSNGTEKVSVTPPGGDAKDNTSDRKRGSALMGKTVRFTRDEKSDEWKAKWAGDDASKDDAMLLENLEGSTDLTAFLPDGDVEVGASWDLDADAFHAIDDPGGELKLAEEDAKDTESQRARWKQMHDALAGKGKATWRGVKEIDGKKVGVIEVEAKLSTKAATDANDEGVSLGIDLEFELAGEIHWNVAAGHVESYQLDGPVKAKFTQTRSIDTPQGKHEIKQVFHLAGEGKNSLAVDA